MKSQGKSEYLWFDGRTADSEIRQEIEKNATTVTRLHVQSFSFLRGKGLTGLELPNLTELLLEDLHCFETDADWSFLHALKALKTLVTGRTTASDSILTGLSQTPFWNNLGHLELKFHGIDKTKYWPSLWNNRNLSLELLCIHYLDSDQACGILNAELNSLKYLIPGITRGAPFLDQLKSACLPSLEDLELRHADVSTDEILNFINAEHPNLPNLKRVGGNFFSDQRYDICDWNGAVVDWSYEQLSNTEVQHQFFDKTKYSILPSNDELEGRSSQGWLRPLKRV